MTIGEGGGRAFDWLSSPGNCTGPLLPRDRVKKGGGGELEWKNFLSFFVTHFSSASSFNPLFFLLSILLWQKLGRFISIIFWAAFFSKDLKSRLLLNRNETRTTKKRRNFSLNLNKWSLNLSNSGGLRSTEVAFLLPTQQPQVRICAQPRLFLLTA